ncbi:P-loop containing nucleoside triphosphate hydrolase protein [Amylocarpus encephaloides]|uniref:P-loop containing nucleoside triphosphate hydrolase protein n=1 Tax=Amylocarpus encephaloides TaxID=45428 RepID=A0A9P8C6A7_9HELO|nr:P-loop containing nucleoside triphosphate hydrolase protein [Amylocarpus encephaloides]
MGKQLVALRSKLPFLNGDKLSTSYFQLLVASNPAPLDYLLLIGGVIAAIGAGIPFPLLGILLGQLVDGINSASCSETAASPTSLDSVMDQVKDKVLLVIYVTIASFSLIYIHTGCWSILGERLVRRLRKQYLDVLLKQEIAFFDTLPAGEVASRLDVDLQAIQTGTSEKVGICISSVSYMVAAYVVAFIKSTKLAGMLCSILPAYLMMALVGGHFTSKYASRVSDHVAAATAVASAGLANIPLIQAFGANARLEAVFAGHLAASQKSGIQKAFAASIQLGSMYFIAYSANALAYWQGSRQIAESVDQNGGNASIGAVFTVILLLVDSSFVISQVAPFLQIFATAVSAFEKLVATIHRTSTIDGTSHSEGEMLTEVSGDLEFRDVSFTYPSRPDVQVLQSFSLRIPATKHTALVGLSGSGKSTVAALIQRLYDPNSGDVYLDGHNLRDINVRNVRGFIGAVSQDSTLLDRSILENIAYGLVNSPSEKHVMLRDALLDSSLPDLTRAIREGANMEDAIASSSHEVQHIVRLVREAAKDADALSFIDRLQHGFATMAGPGGKRISGGQKQRVALARALVRSPSILLLDEATASLDSASERLIQSALDRVSIGRTTITIAHRLSTVKNAQNIVVVGPSEILEQGTYMELVEKNGAFASMIRLQSLEVAANSTSAENEILPMGSTTEYKTKLEGQEKAEILREIDATHEKSSAETKRGLDTDAAPQPQELEKATEPEESKRSFLSTFFGIIFMARRHALFVLFGISGALIVGGSYSGEAVIFGHTISDLNPCRGSSSIRSSGKLFGLLFFLLGVVEFFANVVSTSSFGRVSEKVLYQVRTQSLRSLYSQDMFWHESENRSPGTLISYVSSDANSLAGITGAILGVMFSIVVSMIAGIILAHVVAWKIAVVLLATVPILLGAGVLRLRILAMFHARHQKAFSQSVSLATEAVESIKTVAVFSLEQEIAGTFDRSLRGPYVETLKTVAYGNFWLATAYSVGNLIYALAYWWGTKQVVEGNNTSLQFFTVLPALLFSAQLCGQLFSLAPDISKASVAAARVLDLIDLGPDKKLQQMGSKPKSDIESSQGSIEKNGSIEGGMTVAFKDVNFSYPARPHIQVLRGLDIHVQPGTFCALVGPSGAGKSTIISLTERFYSPSSGSIELDGINTSKIDSVSFRDEIALVPQTSVLFDATVKFNLALGARPGYEPSLKEIQEACQLANIHDTITALPQGYETPCGSNGDQFSGGQMQRLSIARALLRKPRLLLLDESTSALDAESERLFEEALEKVAKGTTVIAIAHRLHTIRRADCIFVIEDGRCVNKGTHEELVKSNASYRDNAMHQSLG